jgi:hypothetical protein
MLPHAPQLTVPPLTVFQQIDVDEATDYSNGSIVLRLFGVTEVPPLYLRLHAALKSHCRTETAFLHMSPVSFLTSMSPSLAASTSQTLTHLQTN